MPASHIRVHTSSHTSPWVSGTPASSVRSVSSPPAGGASVWTQMDPEPPPSASPTDCWAASRVSGRDTSIEAAAGSSRVSGLTVRPQGTSIVKGTNSRSHSTSHSRHTARRGVFFSSHRANSTASSTGSALSSRDRKRKKNWLAVISKMSIDRMRIRR